MSRRVLRVSLLCIFFVNYGILITRVVSASKSLKERITLCDVRRTRVVADIIAGLGQGKSEVVFVHQNLISNVYYLLLKRFAYVTLRQDSLVVSGLN